MHLRKCKRHWHYGKDLKNEAQRIADIIVNMKILSEKSIDDCTHIGVALSNQLDYIISWNFKHMVNVKSKGLCLAFLLPLT